MSAATLAAAASTQHDGTCRSLYALSGILFAPTARAVLASRPASVLPHLRSCLRYQPAFTQVRAGPANTHTRHLDTIYVV